MTRRKRNKLVFGVGINDHDGVIRIDGKIIPSYSAWSDMLRRCYDPKYHAKQPTYIGTAVSDEWKRFSNFNFWYDQNYQEGYHLDKDFLSGESKIYSPDTCVFVPSELNSFLTNKRSTQGELPTGVYWNKEKRKYKANIKLNGKQKYLGRFDTPDEAHLVYATAKQAHLEVLLDRYQENLDPRITSKLYEMLHLPIEDFKQQYC